MEENITQGLFNIDSLNEAAKGKVRAIDIDLIEENRLNDLYSQEDIDGLKDNIREFQLSQPLIVRKINNSKYRLISGHRRLKACRELFSEGGTLYFFDKEYHHQLPCILDEKEYKDEDDELLAIVSSNSQRILSKEERKKIYEALNTIYEHKCAKGEKPPGRAREIISRWMGISARTVQNYKSESNNEKPEKPNNTIKIIKRFVSLERLFTDLDKKDLEDEDLISIKEAAIPAINTVMQMLDIEITDL